MEHPEIPEKRPNYGSFTNLVKNTRMKICINKKYIFLSSELSLLCFSLAKFCLYQQVKLIQNQEGAHGLLAKLNEQILDTLNCTDMNVSHMNVRQLLPVKYGFLFFATGQA